MRTAAVIVACGLAFLASTEKSSAQLFNQVIVFGDSTVDSGYFKALSSPGSSSAYNADWSAAVSHGAGAPTSSPGLMNSQMLAAFFGLSANPANTAGGTNYATSGAKNVMPNGAQNGGFTAAIPTHNQISNYLTANNGVANAQALYLINSGGNDVAYAAGTSGSGPYPSNPNDYVIEAAEDLGGDLLILHNAGAQNIIVTGLAYDYPTGNDATSVQIRALRLLYTQTLFQNLTEIGVPFYPADIDSVRLAISAHPSQYGFTSIGTGNVGCTQPAGVSTSWALLCSSNPSAPSTWVSPTAPQIYLFADDQHFGTAGQQLEANYMYRLIVPPTVTHTLSGDGKSDIIWRDSSGNLAFWLMQGAQITGGDTYGQVPKIWSVAGTRDFNNDGRSDILWLDTSGNLGVWLMNGTQVSSRIGLGNVGTTWTVAGTGDFNGDGTGDILWRNTSTGDTAIWFMSQGQFSSGVDLGAVPLTWSIVGVGDFNGDGASDILWKSSSGDVGVWLMNGATFTSAVSLGNVGTSWTVVGTGDFDGDGTSDILWRDTSGNLAIWLMSNGQRASGVGLAQVPLSWSVAETGDFDGDGKSDILWLDNAGNLGVWLMNGLTVKSPIEIGGVGTSWQPQGKNAD
jgi:phospholipase/lecithinase/hemolysin